MQITEVVPETIITIEVIQGLAKIQLTSKAIKGVPQGLLVECIHSGDKVVGFETETLVIYNMYMLDPETDKLHMWKEVQIRKVLLAGKLYHLVQSKDDSTIVNRRDSFRVYIGLKGIAQLGSHRNAYDVVVKDLSESGFSIITTDDIELNDTTQVRVSFSDNTLRVKFDLNGVIVRKATLPNGTFLYGCTLKGTHVKLSKYLAKKQLESAKYTRFKKDSTLS